MLSFFAERWRVVCANGTQSADVSEDYALGLLHVEAMALSKKEIRQSCGPHTILFFDGADWKRYTNPDCALHADTLYRPITTEIEGRVLVCDECARDTALREHAKEDWR